MARANKERAAPNDNRPRALIDWKLVDHLLAAGCNGKEIAAYLGIHWDTLYRRCISDNGLAFSYYAQDKKAIGDAILKTTQFDEASKNKNTSLLIWLGKCRLGQRELHAFDIEEKVKFQVVNYGEKDAIPYQDANEIEVEVEKMKDKNKEITEGKENNDAK